MVDRTSVDRIAGGCLSLQRFKMLASSKARNDFPPRMFIG